MVQYIPDNFKIGVVSLMSQLQLVSWCCLPDVSVATGVMVCHGSSWFVMVHHGLILLCHLVLNFIKTNAASSDKFLI